MDRRTGRLLLSVIGLALALVAGWMRGGAKESPRPAPHPAERSSSPRAEPAAARTEAGQERRDLSRDEEAGGHTLRRHVGKSDDELAERLGRERGISAASTWSSRDVAERDVGRALAEGRATIDRWLARDGKKPNLVLDVEADGDEPFGRSLRRGESASRPCRRAKVVLRDDGHGGFYVLTAYPEADR